PQRDRERVLTLVTRGTDDAIHTATDHCPVTRCEPSIDGRIRQLLASLIARDQAVLRLGKLHCSVTPGFRCCSSKGRGKRAEKCYEPNRSSSSLLRSWGLPLPCNSFISSPMTKPRFFFLALSSAARYSSTKPGLAASTLSTTSPSAPSSLTWASP